MLQRCSAEKRAAPSLLAARSGSACRRCAHSQVVWKHPWRETAYVIERRSEATPATKLKQCKKTTTSHRKCFLCFSQEHGPRPKNEDSPRVPSLSKSHENPMGALRLQLNQTCIGNDFNATQPDLHRKRLQSVMFEFRKRALATRANESPTTTPQQFRTIASNG